MVEQTNLKNDEIRELSSQEMEESQGGTGEPRLTFSAVDVTLRANKATPVLLQFCAEGTH